MIINFPGDRGKVFEHFHYPAGEQQVRILPDFLSHIRNAEHLIVVSKPLNAEDIVGTLLLVSAFSVFGIGLDLILPYLPYSRADRRFQEGDCHGLSVFGEMLNGLAVDRVVTLDAHSTKAHKKVSNLVNVSPITLIQKVQNQLKSTSILLPDKGAERYGFTGYPTCEKIRDQKTGVLTGFTVPPLSVFEDGSILIVDDICDGGGTFIGIAQELRKQGCNLPLFLYVTHGIFSKGTEEMLKHFVSIVTTDSFETQFRGVTRLPALPLLLEA